MPADDQSPNPSATLLGVACGDFVRRRQWFPDLECDQICDHLGCGAQGLLIHMRASGVPQSEIGGDTNFRPTNAEAWQVLPGLCGEGSWGPFRAIEHASGFRVMHFPASSLIVCNRPEPAPQWHYRVMDSLKTDEPYTRAADNTGNICHDVLGFLLWVEGHQPYH